MKQTTGIQKMLLFLFFLFLFFFKGNAASAVENVTSPVVPIENLVQEIQLKHNQNFSRPGVPIYNVLPPLSRERLNQWEITLTQSPTQTLESKYFVISANLGLKGTLLQIAALSCQTDLVSLLIRLGAKIDALSGPGYNVLHFAAVSMGYKDCSKLVEKSTCNVEDFQKLVPISNILQKTQENFEAYLGSGSSSEEDQSLQGHVISDRIQVILPFSTRSSETLCLLLSAISNQHTSQKMTQMLSAQDQAEGKTPAHLGAEYIGAFIYRRIERERTNEINSQEMRDIYYSMVFFSLLRIAGADFEIETNMRVFDVNGMFTGQWGRMSGTHSIIQAVEMFKRISRIDPKRWVDIITPDYSVVGSHFFMNIIKSKVALRGRGRFFSEDVSSGDGPLDISLNLACDNQGCLWRWRENFNSDPVFRNRADCSGQVKTDTKLGNIFC